MSDSESFKLEKADVKSYGFTLHMKDADEQKYVAILETIKKIPHIKLVDYVFETAEISKLHVHGIIQHDSGYRFPQKRFRFPRIHIHLVEIYDAQGWNIYLMKQQEQSLPLSPKITMPKHSLFKKQQI